MKNKNTPYTYEEVKKYIESFGYKLLSKKYINAHTHLEIQCDKEHIYKATFSAFKNGKQRCPYCHGRLITKEKSVGFLYPNIAKMIVEDKRNGITYEDTYEIAPYTHIGYYFKCLNCKKESTRKRRISDVIRDNFSCEFCSDGISMPEKFMANILNQLNIMFISQYSTEWSNNKRYDFYIPSLNLIIETHGKQHYEHEKGSWSSLNSQQENDNYKKELALVNGIKEYIIIDCRYSKFEWLKENIIKELGRIFNLSNINWYEAWNLSQKSFIVQVCELWNSGLCVKDISEQLKLSNTTIREYLKNGKMLDLCDYTTEKGIERGRKKTTGKKNGSSRTIICLTTKEIFFTMKDAMEKYNIKSTGALPACCKGYVIRKGKKEKIKSVGKTKDGKPLVWRYLNWKHNKKYRIKIKSS